jgi:hypothetical protein
MFFNVNGGNTGMFQLLEGLILHECKGEILWPYDPTFLFCKIYIQTLNLLIIIIKYINIVNFLGLGCYYLFL